MTTFIKRHVTERDFRMPEFLDAKIEDYEFSSYGKLVRKDRWERAVMSLGELLGVSDSEAVIDNVVSAVKDLTGSKPTWIYFSELGEDRVPPDNAELAILLSDGSVLYNANYETDSKQFYWNDGFAPKSVLAWRIL